MSVDATAGGRPKFSGGRLRWPHAAERLEPWLAGAAVIGALELAARTGALPSDWMPAPSTIVRVLYDEVQAAEFWKQVWQTLESWALGFALAGVIAIPFGIVLGSQRFFYYAFRALIDFLRPVPGLALLPLLVLVVGIGLEMKVLLIAIASLWPFLFQSMYGAQDVDSVARDMARAYRLSRFERFWHLLLPSATPYIATGARLAAIVAIHVAVAVEVIVGAPGVGRAIAQAQEGNRIDDMWGYIIASGVLGLLINEVFRRLERRVLHWHPSERSEVPS